MVPPAFSIGLRIASSSWLRVRFGTRYCVALTASDSPWKYAQSPMKSERMVIEHAHVFDAAAVGVEQDLHELGRFVARARFLDPGAALAKAGEAEAEQFLELIDDQQQAICPKAARFVKRAFEAETRLAQAIFDPVAAPAPTSSAAVVLGETRKRLGQA